MKIELPVFSKSPTPLALAVMVPLIILASVAIVLGLSYLVEFWVWAFEAWGHKGWWVVFLSIGTPFLALAIKLKYVVIKL